MLGIHNLNPKHSESKTLPNIATTYGAASFLSVIFSGKLNSIGNYSFIQNFGILVSVIVLVRVVCCSSWEMRSQFVVWLGPSGSHWHVFERN